ncbi:Kinase, NEK [Giardia lamblia P15]|uniref:non-specific serine/threonine protein kinase n=1 Tax=Giardia intestinalis (strain P15) TaxID=658858 RepID=E1EY47_GIAIA|nr:Kinase, NEK [Giardia lamblia P15]
MYDKNLINNTYRVIGLCGSGSYGKVYRVQHVNTSEIYACKEICYTNMGAKERGILEQEVNIVTTLVHPHIIRHHEIIHDKASEVLYVIMEFCTNGDLSSIMMNAKRAGNYLSEAYILDIGKQVLDALVYCHSPFKFNPATSKGPDTGSKDLDSSNLQPKVVLHRDIKPANLLVNHSGAIKLADFGFCRVLSSTTDMTATRAGTPLYMAPELLQGKGYTAKADIWSLGITLYEICSFRLPYPSPTIDDLQKRISTESRKPLPKCYSEKLTSVIDLMLTVDPVARPTAAMVLEYITYVYNQQAPCPTSPPPAPSNIPLNVQNMAQINTYGLRALSSNTTKTTEKPITPLLARDAIRAISATTSIVTKSGPVSPLQSHQSATIKKLQEDILKLSEAQKTTSMELVNKSNEIFVLKEQLKTAKLTSQRHVYELEQLKNYVAVTYGQVDAMAPDQPSYADLLATCGQYTMEIANLKAELVHLKEQFMKKPDSREGPYSPASEVLQLKTTKELGKEKGLQTPAHSVSVLSKSSVTPKLDDINVECLEDSLISDCIPTDALNNKKSSESMILRKIEQQLHKVHGLMLVGGDTILRDSHGNTMLMHAAASGYSLLVRCLCATQAKHKNNMGETALILSIQNGHHTCAQTLLPYEKDIPDLLGKLPEFYALNSPNKNIQALFLS